MLGWVWFVEIDGSTWICRLWDECGPIPVLCPGVPVAWRTAAIHLGKDRTKSIRHQESKWSWPIGRRKVPLTAKWSMVATRPLLSCGIRNPECGICATRRKLSSCGHPLLFVRIHTHLPVIFRWGRGRWPCPEMVAARAHLLAGNRPRHHRYRRKWIATRSHIQLELPPRMFLRYW